MVSKRYNFDEETVNRIKTIQQAKGLKTEKEVLLNAINQYLLSEMIEDESVEFQTYQKMNSIENELKRLNNKNKDFVNRRNPYFLLYPKKDNINKRKTT